MKEHFCNYDSMTEATFRADLMNRHAQEQRELRYRQPRHLQAAWGWGCMNAGLYRYSAGPALQTPSMTADETAMMGGLYRERLSLTS